MNQPPFKLNIPGMQRRLNRCTGYDQQIHIFRNLMILKKSGFLPVSDLVQLARNTPIPAGAWYCHTIKIRKAESLLMYGELISFYERCGMIRITQDIRECMYVQLEAIYKSQERL